MPLSRDAAQAQLEEIDRRGGLSSLYHLAKFILGYKDLDPAPHMDICGFAESIAFASKDARSPAQTGGLDIEPRGVFKTTIFSQSLPVLLILRNPNIRILLTSSVLQNSVDNLGVVEKHFEHNSKLRHLYGDFKGEHWVLEEMTVSKRTRMDLKEPTVRAASVGKVQVGPHYDVIIADDLVDVENASTAEGRKKVRDYVRLLFSLLEPNGIIVFVGTPYHYEDAYSSLKNPTEFPELTARLRKASSEGRGDGELYFPKRLTRDFLKSQMRRQGRDIYAAQYDGDPAPEDEDSPFKRSWFRPYSANELPAQRYTFITIDPGGAEQGSDEYVFFVAHCSAANDLYFDTMDVGRYGYEKAIDIVFGLVMRFNPLSVGLETTAQQKYLAEAIRREMRRRNVFFNLVELPHAHISKESRIKTLQPRYECKSIFHSREMGPLEEQLRRFPKGRDDIADAAAQVLEVCQAPATQAAGAVPITSLDQYFAIKDREQREQSGSHTVLGGTW